MDLTNTTFLVENVKGNCVLSSSVFKCGYNFNSGFIDCEAYGSYFTTVGFGDGFSVTADNVISGQYNTNVIANNLWSHDNADDGLTNHKGTFLTVIGGLFEYNGNGITPASGGDCEISNVLVRNNTIAGISCVGSPLDGSQFTEALINSSTCKNNGNNYYLYNQSGLKMTANNCYSIQGSGYHISSGVIQNDCVIINE